MNKSDQPGFKQLSEVIAELPEGHRRSYHVKFKEAVRIGDIDALPIETTFEYSASRKHVDHLIVDDSRFEAWDHRTRKNLVLRDSARAKGTNLAVFKEDVLNGSVDIAKQVEAYRRELRKNKSNAKRKPKAKDLTDPIQVTTAAQSEEQKTSLASKKTPARVSQPETAAPQVDIPNLQTETKTASDPVSSVAGIFSNTDQ
ncbi:hypothetical protein [Deinococcus fonticola]|uniref:hypothetical protein n=1 Tax=Deinococcus fonticola TaxID=2528713 RepID=UPI0010755916|nr:hypothetical protein [Deinococcus fonticola]